MLGLRAMNRAIQAVAFALLLTGCGHDIWNAGDLVKWVRNEAVKNGCGPASVQLADWYVAKNGQNVWPVECTHRQTGESMKFDVGVNKVWKSL